MKKGIIFTLFMLILGCNSNYSEGYILEVSDSEVLVLEDKIVGKTWNELFGEYPEQAKAKKIKVIN